MSLEIQALPKKNESPFSHPNANIIPKHPFRLALCGASGSGKTNCLINLIVNPNFYAEFFKTIIIISPNFNNDQSYQYIQRYVDKKRPAKKRISLFVYEAFEDAEMNQMMEERDAAKKQLGEKLEPCLVVLDDILADTNLLKSSFMTSLFTRGRHYAMSTMIASQSFMKIPRTVRLNCTHFVLFKFSNEGELKRVYDEIVTDMKLEVFERLSEMVFRKPYTFLVINTTRARDRIYVEFKYAVNKKE
jgi:hypothetical protein